MQRPIRVLIVDDSLLMQRALTALLHQDAAIEVVGTATNGREAITLVEQLRPDLVTMDVQMPILDGLATTQHIMAHYPTPILVITAAKWRSDVDITFRMLGAGALEVIEKPDGSDPQSFARQTHALIRRVKLLANVRVVRHLRGRTRVHPTGVAFSAPAGVASAVVRQPMPTVSPHLVPQQQVVPFPVIVIGASTGGPRVVSQILQTLPADFAAAVLVVQHIAEGFSAGMAEWLALNCRLPLMVAQEHTPVQAGTVLIAPDRSDLLLEDDGRVHLSRSALLLQRPAIDVAMQAAAAIFGPRCIGVLLTGMGRDGAYGMLTIKRAGGHTIAQDEASSAIFGMPRAAIDLGAAAEVLPASTIGARLIELVGKRTVGFEHAERRMQNAEFELRTPNS